MPSRTVLIILVTVYAILGASFYHLGKGSARASENPEGSGSSAKSGANSGNSKRGGSKKKAARSFRLEDVDSSTKDLKELDALSLSQLMKQIEAEFDGGVEDQAAIGRAWNMIQLLGDKDIDSALDYAEKVAPPKGQFLTLLLLPRLAQFRGADAMTAVNERMLPGQMQMIGSMMVLTSWGSSDPDGAFDWYLKERSSENGNSMLKNDMMGGAVMATLFSNLARQDPDRAFERLAAIEDTKLREGALSSMAMMGDQPEIRDRLVAEISQIEDTQRRRSIQGLVASNWARSEPREAIAWAEGLEDEADRSAVTKAAGLSWMQNEPEAAGNYLLEIAGESERQNILNNVTNNWASRDSAATLAWLDTNAEGEERDNALASGVNHLVNTDAETALTWAAEVRSEETRSTVIASAFTAMSRQSGRSEAIATLRASSLPEATVTSIIESNPEAASDASLNSFEVQRTAPAE